MQMWEKTEEIWKELKTRELRKDEGSRRGGDGGKLREMANIESLWDKTNYTLLVLIHFPI